MVGYIQIYSVYKMQNIADFLGCCSKEVKEPKQITVIFNQRVRSYSQPITRTARIKRSLGKDHTRDDNLKPHHNNTALTLTCTRSSKFRSKPSKDLDSNSSFQHSYHEYPHLYHPNENRTGSQKMSSRQLGGQKYQNVINYEQQHCHIDKEKQLGASINFSGFQNMQIHIDSPIIKTNTPRLLLERKYRKIAKDPQGISLISTPKEENRGFSSKRTVLQATVLEPIEERLSMPSCSESQVHDSRQIFPFSSRTVHFSESARRLQQTSQSDTRYRSCIFHQDHNEASPFQTAQSQYRPLNPFEALILSQNHQLLSNKLKIDLQIHQNQLKALLDEENLLRDQSNYSKKRFLERLSHLQQVKAEMEEKVGRFEKEMREMKNVIRAKMNETDGKDMKKMKEGEL